AQGWSAPYSTRFRSAEESEGSFVRVELLQPGEPFDTPADPQLTGQLAALLFMRENGAYFQFNRGPDGYRPISNHPERLLRSGNRWRYLAEDDVEELYDG